MSSIKLRKEFYPLRNLVYHETPHFPYWVNFVEISSAGIMDGRFLSWRMGQKVNWLA